MKINALAIQAKHFPRDLVFQLSRQEWLNLRCQIGISSSTGRTGKCDSRFKVVFDAIRSLMAPPDKKMRTIGFIAPED